VQSSDIVLTSTWCVPSRKDSGSVSEIGPGLPLDKVVSSTAATSCLASLGVGLFANLPVGLAPGMGLNAYLVYSQVWREGPGSGARLQPHSQNDPTLSLGSINAAVFVCRQREGGEEGGGPHSIARFNPGLRNVSVPMCLTHVLSVRIRAPVFDILFVDDMSIFAKSMSSFSTIVSRLLSRSSRLSARAHCSR
jgi:hypothetical protein